MNLLTEPTQQWIKQQKLFFVATAPLQADGHVNCSPKGLDSFRIVNETTVVYMDLVGSGAETIAHIQENKRLTIMFCAFDGAPKIVRLYGEGEVILPAHSEFTDMRSLFPTHTGLRSFIRLHIHRVGDSCGYAVPKFTFEGDRDVLDKWVEHKGAEGVTQYIQENNALSLDGLPTLI